MRPKSLISLLINVILSIVEALLSLRIVLKLFGASVGAPFVSWVYETTSPLLTPFLGIFPSPKIEGFIIEFSSLFALIIYSIVGYLLIELIDAIDYYVTRRKD